MKLKKSIAVIAAAVTALTMGSSGLTACKSGCDHAYQWTVDTAATCTTEGLRHGLCGICGDVTEEVIPVSDEHPYGEWDITPPTEQAAGKAVKSCSASVSHLLEVALPAITADGAGYDSCELTKPATSISKGEKTYVLKHAAGDISFIVYTPEKEVETVEDAVLIGSSKKELIRRVEGNYSTDTTRYNPSKYYYEFGENYMHSREEGSKNEIWCSLDENGEAYLIRTELNGPLAQEVGATPDNMNGFGYALGYSRNERWYGLEALLSGLYSWGSLNTNMDFRQSVSGVGSARQYKFEFGTHTEKYYSKIYVQFTLTDTYAINTLNVDTEVYDAGKWELNEETEIARPIVKDPSGRELITAKTILCASPEGQEVPQNPYTRENFAVKSFDLYYGTTKITDETVTSIPADTITEFGIKNIVHRNEKIEGNLAFDPVSYYLRTASGDKPISFDAQIGGIAILTKDNSKVSVRSFLTGELTIVIKTQSASFEKIFKLNVSKIAPPNPEAGGQATFFPSVYLFGGESYYWQSFATASYDDMRSNIVTYIDQPLRLKADIPSTMLSYVDPSASAQITSAEGAEVSDATVTAADDEENVHIFTATKKGVYTVRLTSTVPGSNRRIEFPVTVTDKPAIGTVLVGTYTGKAEYPTPNDISVRFDSNGATEGKITVSLGSLGSEVLSYKWDGEKLITEHFSGRSDAENGFGFTIMLNQAFNVVVVHPRGVGDETETLVLYKK